MPLTDSVAVSTGLNESKIPTTKHSDKQLLALLNFPNLLSAFGVKPRSSRWSQSNTKGLLIIFIHFGSITTSKIRVKHDRFMPALSIPALELKQRSFLARESDNKIIRLFSIKIMNIQTNNHLFIIIIIYSVGYITKFCYIDIHQSKESFRWAIPIETKHPLNVKSISISTHQKGCIYVCI